MANQQPTSIALCPIATRKAARPHSDFGLRPSVFGFLLLLSTLSPHLSTVLAQGSLTPPGAPAPTMKSLDQLGTNILQVSNLVSQVSNQVAQLNKTLAQSEPRYPISAYGTNLTLPGSYYLTTNVLGPNTSDAINIRTNINNISIDLNGFSMICTNPAGGPAPVGVRISEASNILIRNGRFSGFDRGVRAEGACYGIIVDHIHVANCHRAGIEATGPAGAPASATMTIRNCVIEDIDGTGEGANVSCDGIALLNCTAVVDSCIVRDIIGVGTGTSSCINALSPTNSFVNDNFLSNADTGLKMSGGGTRVFYRNNLTGGCGTPFSGTGGVDRGGNF